MNGNAARGLVEGWSRCALLLGAPGRSIAGHGGCNLACQRPWAVRTPMLLGSLRRVGLAQDMKGGPGYRGVPPASHYIPPGLLLTPSLVGRRSADSVRTVRGVNGNAARGLVEGWSRCALLLGPPPESRGSRCRRGATLGLDVYMLSVVRHSR